MSTYHKRPFIVEPNPLETDAQYNRYYHLDLPALNIPDLWEELHFLQPRLWGLPPDSWLRERVQKLRAEISKRQIGAKYTAKGNQFKTTLTKPKPAEGVRL